MSKIKAVAEVLSNTGNKLIAKKMIDIFCKNMSYLNEFEEVGNSYYFLGYVDKAIQIFENALVLAPNPAQAFFYRNVLIQMYIQANKPNRALIYINLNEKINPSKELAYLRIKAEEQIEILRGIKNTGFWDKELAKKHHVYSAQLCKWVGTFFDKNVPTYDFGCGTGSYLKDLETQGFTNLTGFEGEIPDNNVFDNIRSQDLTKTFDVNIKGNVLFLEVGEHIPAQYQQIVLDNVCNACDNKLVMSWAVRGQGGTGHVNELDNYEVIPQVEKRGFCFLPKHTEESRLLIEDYCPWFRGSTLVFERKK